MRIDGTHIVPGATASQEKRRQDARGKSAFSLGVGKATQADAGGAITPSLGISDIDAVLDMQAALYDDIDDSDTEAVRASELLLDQLSRFQEDILNHRNMHMPLLEGRIKDVRSAADKASTPVRAAAMAAVTRAEILLLQHTNDTSA